MAQADTNVNGFAIAIKLSEIDATVLGELVLGSNSNNNLGSDNTNIAPFYYDEIGSLSF
jgi:hypothetical protein